MHSIFETFPALSDWDIVSSLVFHFPHNLTAIVWLIGFMFWIFILVVIISGFLETNKDELKDGKTKEEYILEKSPLVIFPAISILIFIAFPFLLFSDIENIEHRDNNLLNINEVKDWYVTNAPLIDKELTSKEYKYIDYVIQPDVTLPIKGKTYLKGLGIDVINKMKIEVINEKGKIETISAYVTIDTKNTIPKNGTIQLKNTAEFGEKYDIGTGIYYGTLFIN